MQNGIKQGAFNQEETAETPGMLNEDRGLGEFDSHSTY